MGCTSYFTGAVDIDPPLNESERSFLKDFATTRRMNRTKGPLYVKGGGFMGQDNEDDVIDSNNPHPDQPELWCQWVPSEDGTQIVWDEGEKFYSSAEWMLYIVKNLLSPSAAAYITSHVEEDERLNDFTCNHDVNGQFHVEGEESDDRWILDVDHNVVGVSEGSIEYGPIKEVSPR